MLYDFKNKVQTKTKKITELLSDFLNRKQYPTVNQSGYTVIRRDLTMEDSNGNIEYRDDGVYLTINGQEYKGYIYLKYKWLYEGIFTPPKFHLTKCEKLKDLIDKGNFIGRYYWHNSNVVSIQEKPTGKVHEDLVLDLCGNCQTTKITTQEFYDELEEKFKDANPKDMYLDIFGYVKEWQQISKSYKEKKDYTCEVCNIKMEGIDRRYIHTDHKNGIKTENNHTNFECLCILCHCYKDEHHRENFGKRRLKRELQTFVDKFRELLRSNKNLERYDSDNE